MNFRGDRSGQTPRALQKTRKTGEQSQRTVGAFEAKTHFSKYLERARAGEEIIITRRGEPIAKLTPIKESHDLDRALAAASRIQRTATRIAGSNITFDEIRAWINEGRL